ncbi:MAG: hypoxanthine phosphoribosyltransferase [Candidatus Nitrospinota bacterium M3_3B_026]
MRIDDKIVELISAEEIAEKAAELGRAITGDYADGEPVLIGVLKGAWVFMADLARNIDLPVACDFLGVSSYGAAKSSSGVVKIVSDVSTSIEGRDVIIIEDIIDTGITLSFIREFLAWKKPRSLAVCALLDKPARRVKEVSLDYTGFTVPDRFVVGYGIDLNEKYRNLPYIGYVKD